MTENTTRLTLPPDFHCQRCGNCCRKVYPGGFNASEDDLERWKDEIVDTNRGKLYFLLDLVDEMTGDLWMNPIDDEDGEFAKCPFLKKLPKEKKYECLIYTIRPDCCKPWPFQEGKLMKFAIAVCPEAKRLYQEGKYEVFDG